MNNKNVVLLGGSNSVMVNGLQKGLREGIAKYNQDKNRTYNLEFYNFALGGTASIQRLYEIVRNRDIIRNSELILCESNVNDTVAHTWEKEYLSLNIIYRNLNWLYQELSFYKKILILILPNSNQIINNIHRLLCKKYNFNLIDMDIYYKKYLLNEFNLDYLHPFPFVSRILGKNIIHNIKLFKTNEISMINDNPNFKIITPRQMENCCKNIFVQVIKNSVFKEEIYFMQENNLLRFRDNCIDFRPIAIHLWNDNGFNKNWTECRLNTSGVIIKNNFNYIIKDGGCFNTVMEIHDIDFLITNKTYVEYCGKNIPRKEYHHNAVTWSIDSKFLNKVGLIAFLLASQEGNYYTTEEIDFEALANESIEIPKEYNFNHLIPPVELYKEIIDEYCTVMDPVKLAPLQKQISALTQEKQDLQNKFQNELNSLPVKKQHLELTNLEQDLIIKKLESKKLAKSLGLKMSIINPRITFIQANSAKARIQNHLSYKLGQALITNSKSILGYIRMPYVLSYIKDKHQLEQKAYEEKIKENPNLALPPLETYPDYNEALKEKECFTYKLGEAFIKAG
ncbi:hypothetical protein ACSW0J_000929, partial [Campylobacter jejuni]